MQRVAKVYVSSRVSRQPDQERRSRGLSLATSPRWIRWGLKAIG